MHVLHRVWIGGLEAPVGNEHYVHVVFGIPDRHFSRSGVWGSVWNVVQGGNCGGMHSGRADSRCSHSVTGFDLRRSIGASAPAHTNHPLPAPVGSVLGLRWSGAPIKEPGQCHGCRQYHRCPYRPLNHLLDRSEYELGWFHANILPRVKMPHHSDEVRPRYAIGVSFFASSRAHRIPA